MGTSPEKREKDGELSINQFLEVPEFKIRQPYKKPRCNKNLGVYLGKEEPILICEPETGKPVLKIGKPVSLYERRTNRMILTPFYSISDPKPAKEIDAKPEARNEGDLSSKVDASMPLDDNYKTRNPIQEISPGEYQRQINAAKAEIRKRLDECKSVDVSCFFPEEKKEAGFFSKYFS